MGGRAAREGFPSAASQSVAADGALLELREAVVRFGGVRALDGVSVSVDKGEMLGLVGPNGSGKTTLLNAITGVYSLAAGQIIWMGRPVRISRPWQALEL
ncbi:MAG: ATP-binding cassette domain-containing protein, partial [Candidatus Kapabacteria bacterium]|nr:ATP-binding cassette domain-containing protein [Candidatus Kapabacteria bacterium]